MNRGWNLNEMADGALQPVFPSVQLILYVSSGYTIGPDGGRAPSYLPAVQVYGDIQALQYTDLMKLEGLNIQGERRKIYLNGQVDGLVRVDNKGGDILVTPDGKIWLVATVLEYWTNWCSVACTLQNETFPLPAGPLPPQAQ